MAGKTFNAYLYISADGFDEDVTLEESNFNVFYEEYFYNIPIITIFEIAVDMIISVNNAMKVVSAFIPWADVLKESLYNNRITTGDLQKRAKAILELFLKFD